jgi:HNH endonuclease
MIRKGRKYAPSEILPLVSFPKNGKAERKMFDEDIINFGSFRLQTFAAKGIVCVSCGLVGSYFIKEKATSNDKYFHLNFYTDCDMMMTKDHIIPKSKGGRDCLENFAPMCRRCNQEKGNNKMGTQSFNSTASCLGALQIPNFPWGVRVMMMPFLLEDLKTLPIKMIGVDWFDTISKLVSSFSPIKEGTAYLTIDQAFIRQGETHRRPGLHVDGVDENGDVGGWGGGGGGWGAGGMLQASNIVGCRMWNKTITGSPGKDGDCSHLRAQCSDEEAIILKPNMVYLMDGTTIHESLIHQEDCYRSFVRLSMPSNAPWYDGYTENPIGIRPTGDIKGMRPGMLYRRSIVRKPIFKV